MNEKVIVIGASGHGKVIADVIQKSGDKVMGFLDDNTELSECFAGFPMLGTIERHKVYIDYKFIIAIGNAAVRREMAEKLIGVKWYTAIHPSSVVSGIDVLIGEGSSIMANAVINAGSVIGKHCIINSGAVVEHDNRIEGFSHISVGARLAGNVHIGKNSWVGIGATVSNNLFVCDDCLIGAGGVVVKNIEEPGTYVGVPVRRIDVKNRNVKKLEGGGSIQPVKWNMRLSRYVQNRRAA